MPTTPPPTITALPSPPDPNNRATFNTLAYPWSVAQQTLATEVGAVAANVYANAQEAQAQAEDAATQASNAALSAADSNTAKLAAQAAQAAAEATVATIPDGTINDATTSLTDVWSSQKVSTQLATKQATLVSGTSIKTLGGVALLGEGDIPFGVGLSRSVRTSNTILGTADKGKLIDITSGTFSQTFDAVATLGAGWWAYLRNSGTGVVTLDPDGSETIDGVATKALDPGQTVIVQCDGTALRTVAISGAGNHYVTVHTGNGHGSANTKIRRFTTTLGSAGTAISYADSATLGASFTINEPGIYEVMYADTRNSSIPIFGISRNSSQLTTSISEVTADSRLGVTYPSASRVAPLSVATRLAAGDVVRAHTDGTTDSTEILVSLTIRKVGL